MKSKLVTRYGIHAGSTPATSITQNIKNGIEVGEPLLLTQISISASGSTGWLASNIAK